MASIVTVRRGNPEGAYVPSWKRRPISPYRTHEDIVEDFAQQFFTAGGGSGTTIQSARARIKKWTQEKKRGDYRHEVDLNLYREAVARYEKLKRNENPFVESLVEGMGTGTGLAIAAGVAAPMVVRRLKKVGKVTGLLRGKTQNPRKYSFVWNNNATGETKFAGKHTQKQARVVNGIEDSQNSPWRLVPLWPNEIPRWPWAFVRPPGETS